MSDSPSPYGLPFIPNAPMTDEELNEFSKTLIEAYSRIRITNPYPRTQGIKSVRIQLPPLETELSAEPVPEVPVEPEPATATSFSTPESRPEQPTAPEPAKCFLHAKPKPTCSRCKTYLDWKQEHGGQKKPRLVYSCLSFDYITAKSINYYRYKEVCVYLESTTMHDFGICGSSARSLDALRWQERRFPHRILQTP